MKPGGQLNALGVCNLEAMPITAKNAADSNAIVSRVNLKNRNPENVPNDWQRAALDEFDKRAADGEDPAYIASATVVKTDDGKHQMRFMKATPAGGVSPHAMASKSLQICKLSLMSFIQRTKRQGIHLVRLEVLLW